MANWMKFGILNAAAGLLIGLYVQYTATGDGYFVFVAGAPLAAFLAGALFWKWLIRPDGPIAVGRVILVGLLTGTVSHYLAFLLVGIGMNLCYWTTGGCVGSLGDEPASIVAMLTGALGFSFFSLLFVGWISVPVSIAIGLILRARSQSK
jgi:hypothetical protein